MGDRLLQIVKQTGIFVVCAQMILHFKPAECYEKYIRLLIGIMVLAQLIAAGSAVFGKEGENFFEGRVDYYNGLLAQSMEGADIAEMEALLEKMTMEEVQAQIEQLKEEQQGGLQQSRSETEVQQGTAPEQSGTVPESREVQQGPNVSQPVEEIDIQIDGIEVRMGD